MLLNRVTYDLAQGRYIGFFLVPNLISSELNLLSRHPLSLTKDPPITEFNCLLLGALKGRVTSLYRLLVFQSLLMISGFFCKQLPFENKLKLSIDHQKVKNIQWARTHGCGKVEGFNRMNFSLINWLIWLTQQYARLT